MYAIIDGLAALLVASPGAVLESARIGARRPATPSDIPAVIASLRIDDHRTTGVGAIGRAGDLPGRPVTEPVTGATYRGLMNVEVWANSLDEAALLARKVQDRVGELQLARRCGFQKLQAAALAATEHVLHSPAVGSPFAVWKQALSYYFAFSAERIAEPSESGPIQRVDVEIGGSVDDTLTVPSASPP